MRLIAKGRVRGLSVCLLITFVSFAETAEPSEMLRGWRGFVEEAMYQMKSRFRKGLKGQFGGSCPAQLLQRTALLLTDECRINISSCRIHPLLRCGLSLKFFDHLFYFVDVATTLSSEFAGVADCVTVGWVAWTRSQSADEDRTSDPVGADRDRSARSRRRYQHGCPGHLRRQRLRVDQPASVCHSPVN